MVKAELDSGAHAAVFAPYRLQEIADYRSTLQRWFGAVRLGGHLFIIVPHAFLFERQSALPSRWNPRARRLYTPRLLLDEIEEALTPNTYRLRHLGDDDLAYDYELDPSNRPVGRHDIVAVIEKLKPPAWKLDKPIEGTDYARAPEHRSAPDFSFEPKRTRVERQRRTSASKILLLKLDHLGDFIMGVPALERVREAFPDAEITLVVGSWNFEMAEKLQLFDHVLPFDAFPRNSSEEAVDVQGKTALFDQLANQSYDLAVDLRTDDDTRILLRNVRARVKAGLGQKSRFEFLDIFLPIDSSRGDVEAARQDTLPPNEFHAAGACKRTAFSLESRGERNASRRTIVWGPYRNLRAGRYLFRPFLEIASDRPGILRYDIAIDTSTIVEGYLTSGELPELPFRVEGEGGSFEFRLWSMENEPELDFRFYGGKLIRAGASGVLHQSEYLLLLVELIVLRFERGSLQEEPER